MQDSIAQQLTELASWIDHQLGIEYTDRQAIAETASSRVSAIARELAMTVVIGPHQMNTLRRVLADALAYRNPEGLCMACVNGAPLLCELHSLDASRTDAYLALAHDLGIEVSR